jgi:hypothetical protein
MAPRDRVCSLSLTRDWKELLKSIYSTNQAYVILRVANLTEEKSSVKCLDILSGYDNENNLH